MSGGLDEGAFWMKLAGLAGSTLIRQALVLYCILTDIETPAWARALIVLALAYLINPFDTVPDAVPGIGLADDAAVLTLLLQQLSSLVTPAIQARASQLLPWNKR